MEPIKIIVKDATATVFNSIDITSDMVGLQCEFNFNSAWKNLIKNVIFKAGTITKTVIAIKDDKVQVPTEVLQEVGAILDIGIEGVSIDGKVEIPTVFATAGRIYQGAQVDDYENLPPVWKQILNIAEGAKQQVDVTDSEVAAIKTSIDDIQEYLSEGSLNIPTGFVTPQQYGAISDGTVDCVEAFNRAFAASQRVYVPAGTYLIDGGKQDNTIKIPSNSTLLMNKEAILQLHHPIEQNCSAITLDQVQNVKIQGGQIKGNKLTAPFFHQGGKGIYIKGSQNIIIDNCDIADIKGDGIVCYIEIPKSSANTDPSQSDEENYSKIESNNIVVSNSVISGMLRHGVWVSGINTITFENVIFKNNGGRASDFLDDSQNLLEVLDFKSLYENLYKRVYDSTAPTISNANYKLNILDLFNGTNNGGHNSGLKTWRAMDFACSIDFECHLAYEKIKQVNLINVTSIGTPFNGIHFQRVNDVSVSIRNCNIYDRVGLSGQNAHIYNSKIEYLALGNIKHVATANSFIGQTYIAGATGQYMHKAYFSNCIFKNSLNNGKNLIEVEGYSKQLETDLLPSLIFNGCSFYSFSTATSVTNHDATLFHIVRSQGYLKNLSFDGCSFYLMNNRFLQLAVRQDKGTISIANSTFILNNEPNLASKSLITLIGKNAEIINCVLNTQNYNPDIINKGNSVISSNVDNLTITNMTYASENANELFTQFLSARQNAINVLTNSYINLTNLYASNIPVNAINNISGDSSVVIFDGGIIKGA